MQKKSTRVLSLVLSIAMVITMMAGVMTASAVSYKDIYNGHWAQSYINYLSDKEVFEGYNDNTFRPSQTVTTAELMAVISRTFGLTATKSVSYADVKSTDWFYPYVAQAAAQGYIISDGAYVYPNQPLTREKAVAMIARYLGLDATNNNYYRFSDSNQISSAYVGYVNAAVAEGIINGYTDGTFKPKQEISRAEIAKIIYTMLGGNIIRENVNNVTSNGGCITKGYVNVSNSYLGGTVYVTEGASGNVTFTDSTITKLVVRGNTTVNLGNTKVGTLVLDSSSGTAAVYATGNTTVQNTTVNTNAALTDSTTTGTAFTKVSSAMSTGNTLSLTGTFPSVTVTTPATTLSVANTTSKITSLVVTNTAANTKVTGKGAITAITVNASGCTTEQMPGQYTIGANLKATFAGRVCTGTGTAIGVIEIIVGDSNTALAAGSVIEDEAVLVLDYGKNYTAVSVTVPAGYKLYNKSGTVVLDNSSYSYARTVTEYCYAGSYTYNVSYGGSYVDSISFTVAAYGNSMIAAVVADSNTSLPSGSTISNGAMLVLDSGKNYTEVTITVPAGYKLYNKDGSVVLDNSSYNYARTVTEYCMVGSYTYYVSYGSSYVDAISFNVSTYSSSTIEAVVADSNTSLPSNSTVTNGATLILDSGKSSTSVTITVPKGYKLVNGSNSTELDNSNGSAATTKTVSCTAGSYTYYLTCDGSYVDSLSFSVTAYTSSSITAVVADSNTTLNSNSSISNGATLTLDSDKNYTTVNITVPAGYVLYESGSEVLDNSSYNYARTAQVTCDVGSYTYYLAYGSNSYVASISFTVSRYGLGRPTYTVSRPSTANGSLTITFDQTMYYNGQSLSGNNSFVGNVVDYRSLISVSNFTDYTVNASSNSITLTPNTYWPSSFTVTISGSLVNEENLTVYNNAFTVTISNYSTGIGYATAPTVSTGSQYLYNGSTVWDSNNDGETIYVTVPANHSLYINGYPELNASSNQRTWSQTLPKGTYVFTTNYNGDSASVTISIGTSYGSSSSTTPPAPTLKDNNDTLISGTVSCLPGVGYAVVKVYVTPGDELLITYPGGLSETVKPDASGYYQTAVFRTETFKFAAVRNGTYTSNTVSVTAR